MNRAIKLLAAHGHMDRLVGLAKQYTFRYADGCSEEEADFSDRVMMADEFVDPADVAHAVTSFVEDDMLPQAQMRLVQETTCLIGKFRIWVEVDG